MNLATVIKNLDQTIAGKERYLADMVKQQYLLPHAEARALSISMEFVEINLKELKAIKADVEACMKGHVGDSGFEGWFQGQPFATQSGVKQMCRDSYAAGMSDGNG